MDAGTHPDILHVMATGYPPGREPDPATEARAEELASEAVKAHDAIIQAVRAAEPHITAMRALLTMIEAAEAPEIGWKFPGHDEPAGAICGLEDALEGLRFISLCSVTDHARKEWNSTTPAGLGRLIERAANEAAEDA